MCQQASTNGSRAGNERTSELVSEVNDVVGPLPTIRPVKVPSPLLNVFEPPVYTLRSRIVTHADTISAKVRKRLLDDEVPASTR